jgi:uncharacterized ion transporter superfamily protein YfcC
MPHALVMMLLIIIAAVVMTYIVPAGTFERTDAGLVVPGTYHTIPKDFRTGLARPMVSTDAVAYPASPLAVVASIPAGMVERSALIFMILFIGGMFGVLEESGALKMGVDRLLTLTRGNINLLAPVLMVLIACGSTFLGLISEYLVIIPMMVLLAERVGYDALVGVAIVTIAAKIGYLTSVTNPLPLVIAQPIVGVPVFSGAGFRLAVFMVFLPIGILYLLRHTRRQGVAFASIEVPHAPPLPPRILLMLAVLATSVVVMVIGAQRLNWGNSELAAMYVAVSLLLAAIAGLNSRRAAQAFLRGMQGMMLAGVLVGLASAVEIVLRDSLVLDSVIAYLSRAVEGRHPILVGQLMVLIQMVIDVFIPSTSGQAAVTMPILGPIGQLAGVSGQVTVQAFLFGNGLTNTITPTSGMLLAYLATGKVAYGAWVRFVFPLVALLAALSLAATAIAVVTGH